MEIKGERERRGKKNNIFREDVSVKGPRAEENDPEGEG